MVDETGGVRQRGEYPVRPATVPAATATDLVDGAIASATMPGIFPARRLADHMCVDGGVKEIVPVQVATKDLGCNQVFAIRVSARPPALPTDPQRTVGEVMARSVLELTYDAVADDDVAPYRGWGDEVKVVVIRPNFNLHDPMVVAPGLIRIAMDYGWLRAADVVDVPENSRDYAMELSDKITRLRATNWTLAHFANGIRYEEPYRGFTDFVFRGATPSGGSVLVPVPDPDAVDQIRWNCRLIRDAIYQRLLMNSPMPPPAVRTLWFTQWETFPGPTVSNDPWAQFISVAGTRNAETPPAPI